MSNFGSDLSNIFGTLTAGVLGVVSSFNTKDTTIRLSRDKVTTEMTRIAAELKRVEEENATKENLAKTGVIATRESYSGLTKLIVGGGVAFAVLMIAIGFSISLMKGE